MTTDNAMGNRRRLHIGVVGLGWPGQMHLKAVLATPKLTLHSVADTSPERQRTFAAEHPGPKIFSGYEEMMADPAVDAVIICLPNFLHTAATLAGLRAGKHVLCEKPPTLHAKEMRQIKAEADQRGLIYAFGRQMRFGGSMVAARKLIKAGKLGDVYFAKSTWYRNRGIPIGIGGWFLDRARAGGGAMIDIGIHTLDNAWFLMGSPRPVSVSAQVFQKFGHLVPDNLHFDVDDCGYAFIKFDNGAVLSLETTWASNLPDTMMPDTNGAISCILHGRKAALQVMPELRLYEGQRETVGDAPVAVEQVDAFQLQMADFTKAIRNGSAPTSDATHALYLMEMLDSIYKSSATGREVRIAQVPGGRTKRDLLD